MIVEPRPAASVILLRGGHAGLELLIVRRTPHARFMAGHWVFPGGAVDASDGPGDSGLRAAARRELQEEAAVVLARDAELVPFARWITPIESPIRFDTWFYLAAAPPEASPQVDGAEIVAFRWIEPAAALAAFAADELTLAFPTRMQLEQIGAYPSADELLTRARERADSVRAVQPRVVGSGAHARIVLPD
jgi:8-oxo-dGTP pyrophosphatase MutT (NUDIX family)